MSHNIQQHDQVTALAKCWHGLEVIVPEITFQTSGLDWQVTEHPITAAGATLEGWKALVRADKSLPLHVFKDSYGVIQNSAIWEAMESALTGIPHEVVTAGSLGNCKRTFISIRLTGERSQYVRGDEFQDYLTFINSFDGFCKARLYGSSTRVVCQNTLNLSLADKGFFDLSVKHTSGAKVAFEGMVRTVQTYLQAKEAAYADLSKLAEQAMSKETAENLLAGFVFDKVAVEGRAMNQGKTMLELFAKGKGNKGETRYDLLNGVTEFYTHNTNPDNRGKALASNMLGTYGERKTEMLDTLLSDDALNAMANRGAAMLEKADLSLV